MNTSALLYRLTVLILCICILPAHALWGKNRARQEKPETGLADKVVFDTLSTVRPAEKNIEEVFDSVKTIFSKMSDDMYEFNFNTIHPYLKTVYGLYEQIRATVLIDQDSTAESSTANRSDSLKGLQVLIGQSESVKPDSIGNTDAASSAGQAATIDSSASFVLQIPSAERDSTSKAAADFLKPDPTKILVKAPSQKPKSAVSFAWKDTSTEYLMQLERLGSNLDDNGNFVFSKVNSLHKKTVKFHRYFDAGEVIVATQQLSWLIEDEKKIQVEVINYLKSDEFRSMIRKQ